MNIEKEPAPVSGAFRVKLDLLHKKPRLDQVLMEALREQNQSIDLRNLSRAKFKELFRDKKILIKGQPATPSSALAAGVTYIDILGYGK